MPPPRTRVPRARPADLAPGRCPLPHHHEGCDPTERLAPFQVETGPTGQDLVVPGDKDADDGPQEPRLRAEQDNSASRGEEAVELEEGLNGVRNGGAIASARTRSPR